MPSRRRLTILGLIIIAIPATITYFSVNSFYNHLAPDYGPLATEQTDTYFNTDTVWDLHFTTDLGTITINGDGTVEYPEDLPEAAKAFWIALAKAFPELGWGPCEEEE